MILAAVLCPIGVYVDNANIYFVCGKSCPKEVYGIQAVIFPGLATVVLLILGGESSSFHDLLFSPEDGEHGETVFEMSVNLSQTTWC
jgi:hypothetical protein